MTASTSTPSPVRFTTHEALIHRLVLATLFGRVIHISQIRSSSPTNPGLAPHEISFLRLLEAVTNGSVIEISYTGTSVVYRPGLITGSNAGTGAQAGVVQHEVPAGCERGISYFLIPLCLLSPFSKYPVNVLFTGAGVITAATPTGDVSVDTVRTAILPLYEQFGIMNKLELRVLRRSCTDASGKGGGGEVQLVFGHQVRLPKTLHLLNPGKVRKVRGVAYCVGVAASNNARMIEAARAVINPLAGDTYIFSDVSSAPFLPAPGNAQPGAKRKTGIGFGLALVAESSTGALFSADMACPPKGGESPEDVGRHCAYQLLETVSHGGCVSLVGAPTVLTLMAMGSEDVGRVQVSKRVLGTVELIRLARDLRAFGAGAWGMRESVTTRPASGGEEGEVVISIVGQGIGNVGRKIA
ncbi:MAG: hypothetical protein M1833_002475 [Piccolia ochrophora]|nr:MAG: hypothetical protein M1833_002475 [Piccolia ochrophora]